MPTLPGGTLRRTLFRIALVLLGMAAPLVVFEVALRAQHDALFRFQDLRPGAWTGVSTLTEYDSRLGWVPRPRVFVERPAGWSASTDEHRLRRNRPEGETVDLAGPPILAIGDSGAFGDEVDDEGTWPAHLEERLGRRVLNAGVSAYGIDQAVLRAERILPELEPTIVVFSIVSDDVNRTALRFWNRWKPFFRRKGEGLDLIEPPPPELPLPESWWRRMLGHSHVAGFVMRKAFPEMWEHRVRRRAHRDEVAVSGLLLERLHRFVEDQESRLLVVLIAGSNGDVRHIEALKRQASSAGLTVLDLSDELVRFAGEPSARERMFRPAFHLSSEGNAWVAARMTERLAALGWIAEPPEAGGVSAAAGR